MDTKVILSMIYESGSKGNYQEVVEYLLDEAMKATLQDFTKVKKYLADNDYYNAPGSCYYHDAEYQGLVKHSLRVVFWAVKYFQTFFVKDKILENKTLAWVIVAALLHDLCKVNRFTKTRKWKKDSNGDWQSVDSYVIKEDYEGLGHGSESMRRLIQLLPNVPFSVQKAVYWHMGLFDSDDTQGFSKAYKEEPMVLCLVTADMLSTQRPIIRSDCEV